MKMREIKFRAWQTRDRENGFMNYDPSLGNGFGGLGVLSGADSSDILMQHIGLKDWRGTGIFEGDIVSGVRADGSVVEAWKGIVKFGKVDIGSNGFEYNCWINGFYVETINDESPSEYLTEDMIKGNILIIGNIYEHPELAVREKDD
jgi:uncharacterized phage protein (TIGR01671 family)